MKSHISILLVAASLSLAACEQTPEQHTASAEKTAKVGAEQGHTEVKQLGELLAAEGWARETTESAVNGVAYLTIVNGTHNGDKLLGVSADFAEKAEIHRSVEEEGVARMKPVPDGLPIPSGATLKLAPGGLHIMLMGLKEPLKAGDVKILNLTFSEAGEKAVPIIVRSLSEDADGVMSAGDMNGGDMDMKDHSAHGGA